MATHGRSGLGRWLYGSVTDEVLRHANVPVFLVPAMVARPWPADRPPRILASLDGSALAQEVVNPASDLAAALGAELVLVRVAELPVYPIGPFGEPYAYTSYDPSAAIAEANAYLEGIAATLRQRGHNVTLEIPTGFPSQEIATVARERQVDVIAMATHGRGGLARLVLGSVATGTLQRTSVPMVLVRPSVLRGTAVVQTAVEAVPATAEAVPAAQATAAASGR